MRRPQIMPYGSWKSTITSRVVASTNVEFYPGDLVLDAKNIYWTEMRSSEEGRNVIVKCTSEGQVIDMISAPFNARTRVHEYGGGAFAVAEDTIYFSNFNDQQLYCKKPTASPHPITIKPDLRYADHTVDRRRSRIVCVCEDHTISDLQPVNTLVSVKLDSSGDVKVLVSGNDFYSSPRLNSDCSRLAWLTWNHPNMPWDGTELWVGELESDGSIGHAEHVVGSGDESVDQPQWSPDGVLHFISDRTGWRNLYQWTDGRIKSLCRMEADYGRVHWRFGLSDYAFPSPNYILCDYTQQGIWRLGIIDTTTGRFEHVQVPYTAIWNLRASSGLAAFVAGSPTVSQSVVKLDVASRQIDVVRCASKVKVDSAYLSTPKSLGFPTENGLTAHAFYYAPRNPHYTGPSRERPPLIVVSHGGPTSAFSTELDWKFQYWTSRGFAVLLVNYGGSSGYGRKYRQRLDNQWGEVDVDDCVNGARYLVSTGEVDGNRLAIRGGSAGGYTTLCALTFRNVFKAGASHFGVSDLETFAEDTHKFESHYLERLVGPYPEKRDLYRRRSPLHFVDQISSPMIIFQGLEDKVVPPSQAEVMVEALRKKGLPVAYITFHGESHGFKQAKNIRRSLDAELYFYSKIFDFKIPGRAKPVQIENV